MNDSKLYEGEHTLQVEQRILIGDTEIYSLDTCVFFDEKWHVNPHQTIRINFPTLEI